MDLSYSSEAETYRGTVTKFLDENWPLKGDDGKLPFEEQALIFRRVATDAGFLYRNIPRKYGGSEQEPDSLKGQVIREEFAKRIAPGEARGIGTMMLVPTLLDRGEEWMKEQFVERTIAGELKWCQGYSEPGSGSDLASLQTRAELVGDEWVINGQKMWTSLADYSDYIWLAARTNPNVKKHKGISMFLVPVESEGFKISPIHTVGGVRTNATFYDDVRVPADHLIGGENNGWRLITGQLNHERISLSAVGRLRRDLASITAWASETTMDGQRVIDKPWVQQNLARVYAKSEAQRLMNWKQAWTATMGQPQMADSSAIKVYGSELQQDYYDILTRIRGHRGFGADADRFSAAELETTRQWLYFRAGSIYSGSNEIQRNIIAKRVLGLPD